MSADFPVAGPARPLRRLWHGYYAVVFAGTIGFVLALSPHDPLGERLAAAGILAVIGCVFLAWPSFGYGHHALCLALFTGACWLVPSSSFVLFALCPVAYMTLRIAPAIVVAVVANLIPTAVLLLRTGRVQMAGEMLPISLMTIAFSVFIGVTIDWIEKRSEERADLLQKLASSQAAVVRLSHEAGAAAERQRLAGDIHDTVAQGLSSVVLLIEAAMSSPPEQAQDHLRLAARTARENLAEARALVGALTPPSLSDSSLVEALRRWVESQAELAAELTVEGVPRALPMPVEVALLRTAQEALRNVRKHSGVRVASVRLAYAPGSVTLRVADQGCGFDPETLHAGYGLGSMRGRVRQVGGELTVHSGLGEGTTVTLALTDRSEP